MLFSDRIGVTAPRKQLQVDAIDAPLRNGLWECLKEYYLVGWRSETYETDYRFKSMMKSIYIDFFKISSDSIQYGHAKNIAAVRLWFYDNETKWYQLYNFIDFMIGARERFFTNEFMSGEKEKNRKTDTDFVTRVNFFLEREKSAYRILGNRLAPITDPEEIKEIERAISSDGKFILFRSHIARALELYAQKPESDYRNSIKESISAVECVAKIASGDDKATLAIALKKIDKTHPIHEALRQAFLKLYGWTSDAGGIRHALLEADQIDEPDARFMLIACSAFGNYLIQKDGDP